MKDLERQGLVKELTGRYYVTKEAKQSEELSKLLYDLSFPWAPSQYIHPKA